MNNKMYIYISAACLLLGGFFLAMNMYNSSQKEKLGFIANQNAEIFVRPHSPRMGNPDAKVFLVEFLDPECESCRAFYPNVKKILAYYEDKVQLVVRYAAFHGNSKIAIAALEAAKKQNKYWTAMELLFETQPLWGDHHNPRIEKIYEILPGAGIDIVKLKEDMKDPAIQDIIRIDDEDLKTLDVKGTPTFFVNGKKPANYGAQALSELLHQEVLKAYPEFNLITR